TESKILWDESDFIFKNEVLPIEISRGCIFDCTYCNLPIRGKKKLENIKTNNTLKEELIRNYELFNVNSYFFCDSTLNDSTQKLINLHSVILDLPFKIQFSSYLRLDLINAHQEQIDILKEMGLKFAVFGIGSLNEKSLKLIRKTFSRSKMENIMLRLKEKWGNDVLTTGSFIYGLPAETPATLIDLEKWLIENSLNYFDYVDVYPLRLSLNDKVNNNLKSNIAINFQNFGFKKDTTEQLKNYNWISETAGIDYVYANRKSEEIIEILHKDNRCKYANINAIGSYNSGLTFDDLKNNTYLTIKQKLLENNIYFSKIKEYKNKLYG
ncbi:MAG: radical SAM protein, partial [Candidatus Woesearchaeota archaeon]